MRGLFFTVLVVGAVVVLTVLVVGTGVVFHGGILVVVVLTVSPLARRIIRRPLRLGRS